MKKNLLAVAVLCALTSGAALAQQSEGPWMVRARAVHLDSANKDSTGLGLSVNNKTIPEVDISYFFNKNVAAELILTVPQKHDLRSNGTNIGSLKHLPPTLSLQYHFAPQAQFRPYVGAGLNYTTFFDTHSKLGTLSLDDSWGVAAQIGVDYQLNDRWFLNADLRYIDISSNVRLNGADIGKTKINPWVATIGVGYRF